MKNVPCLQENTQICNQPLDISVGRKNNNPVEITVFCTDQTNNYVFRFIFILFDQNIRPSGHFVSKHLSTKLALKFYYFLSSRNMIIIVMIYFLYHPQHRQQRQIGLLLKLKGVGEQKV